MRDDAAPMQVRAEEARASEAARSLATVSTSRRRMATYLGLGIAAILLAMFALPWVAFHVPFGILALDVFMVLGLLGVLRMLALRFADVGRDPFIVALSPFLAVPFMMRLWAGRSGVAYPLGLRFTVAIEVLLLAVGLVVWLAVRRLRADRGARHAGVATFLAGSVAALAFLGAALASGTPVSVEGFPLLSLAVFIVASAVLVQRIVATRLPWPTLRAWSSGPALAMTAAQLLDGVVTYLAVKDPLGLAPGEYHEEVALSALILRYAGIAYPLLKWALALGVTYAIERWAGKEHSDPAGRVTYFLTLIYVGLGPGLYSSIQIL